MEWKNNKGDNLINTRFNRVERGFFFYFKNLQIFKVNYVIIFLLLFTQCQTTTFTKSSDIPDGYYYGSKGYFRVFVKSTKENTKVDVFFCDKRLFHVFHFDDNENTNFLNEKTYHFYLKKDKVYTVITLDNGKTIQCKIKKNESKYDMLDVFKNEAFLDSQPYFLHTIYNESNQMLVRNLYEDLKKEFRIKENIFLLKHDEFIKVYEAFKAKFFLEVEKIICN